VGTLIHAVGKRPNQVYRVYGEWGERRFPRLRSKSDLYAHLRTELGLPAIASRWEVVRTLVGKSWDGSRWVDDFRTRLKAARETKGLTQAQLAERANLSLDGVRALEQGIRRPGLDTLRQLAVALQVNVEDLAGVPVIESGTESYDVVFGADGAK
jgi:DNA-binding XRE family transcriptional regulator